MEKKTIFKCLRCGHEFKGLYDKNVPKELECTECGSNSIRLLQQDKT